MLHGEGQVWLHSLPLRDELQARRGEEKRGEERREAERSREERRGEELSRETGSGTATGDPQG